MRTHDQPLHPNEMNHAPHPHGTGGNNHGLHFMAFLGFLQHTMGGNSQWMSDYRNTRLLPVSHKVIIGTLLLLLVGVGLWYILPTSLSGLAIGLILLTAALLTLLVIGGLSVALFIRQQRTRVRQTVIGAIPWRGTENVLDVGCGTGMLLNGCARHLTMGKAIGIDLWQESVAGSPDVLLANAKAEGVANKVEYQTMDARHLAFEDARFSVVVSSLALHHIGHERADREQALTEMIRVLAPSGYLSLADVGPMIDIAEAVIAQTGLQIVNREQTRLIRFVTARKA